MKKIIFILTVLAVVVGGCKQKGRNNTEKICKENIVMEDSAISQILPIEVAEENFQKNTIWNCEETNTVAFRKFQPDTLMMDFDYIPFDVSESYKANDLKFLFGYYKATDKGELSPYDSETNYGYRLLCFNMKNQIIFRSRGHMDTYLFTPHFYISNDKKQIVILCQEGTEYYWGADVFLIEKNNVYDIGFLNVEQYNEEDESSIMPISSVTNIKRIGNTLEFTFGIDSLTFDPGGQDSKLVTNIKYVYKTGKLTMKRHVM